MKKGILKSLVEIFVLHVLWGYWIDVYLHGKMNRSTTWRLGNILKTMF